MASLPHAGARRQSSGVFAAAEEERREEQLSAQHIQTLELTPLGGGAEVGRSCLILKFRGKTIMLDCGLLPSFTGMLALPFLSELNPADIDIVIITHFHIDHAAGLPYFTERMAGFRGRIFATYPTIAVMKIVLSDYVKVSTAKADTPEGLYTQEDVNSCVSKMEAVDLYSKIDVDGVKMQFFNAGHVLGAAMVLMDIAGVRVLYTGDYSCEEDRHLMAAALPRSMPPVDVLIVEATHGMTTLESREKRETRFCESIIRIVKRGGRCLIPQFALGRAQELLLIVDELWESNPELQHIPVYFANNMASKGLEVYRTFVNYMNEKIQNSFGSYSLAAVDQAFRNPWDFKHIRKIRGKDDFKDTGPCVMFASPGMLQKGLSRDLFFKWCEDDKNGIILAGFSTEGSLAKELETNPTRVETDSHHKVHRRMTIDKVSFSAHADAPQTNAFIDDLKPRTVILVHGERNEMAGLHKTLVRKYHDVPQFSAFMPRNGATVALPYEDEVVVKLMGSLAARRLAAGMKISGVLVQRNYKHMLIAPSDLSKYTEVATHSIQQKQHVPYRGTLDRVRECVQAMYADVRPALFSQDNNELSAIEAEERAHDTPCRFGLVIADTISLIHAPPDRVVLCWSASPTTDMIADSLVALVSQAEASPASLRAALLMDESERLHRRVGCGGGAHHHHGHNHGHSHGKGIGEDRREDGGEGSAHVETTPPEEAADASIEEGTSVTLERLLMVLTDQYGAAAVRHTVGEDGSVMVTVHPVAEETFGIHADITLFPHRELHAQIEFQVHATGDVPPELSEMPQLFEDAIQTTIDTLYAGLEPLSLSHLEA